MDPISAMDTYLDDEPPECPYCGGSGTVMTCCDDLCHGQGYCIHGDEDVCPACEGSGEA